MFKSTHLRFCLAVLFCTTVTARPDVVVYTSVDLPHAAPLFERFTKLSGISIKPVFDAESSKTVGLFNRLVAERNSPRADVFWSSELVHTILLKRKNLTEPYLSPGTEYRKNPWDDSQGNWAAFAARARVFLWNTNLTRQAPSSINGVLAPAWKGRFAMANPLFGTTSTQVSSWFCTWGKDRAMRTLLAFKSNGVVITQGNAAARDLVASGEIPLCITDTDDAWAAISRGRPVQMAYPDQGPDDDGVLIIPNSVCLIKGAPHAEQAKKFIDFLLSPEVEEMLAFSESAQIPLRPDVKRPPHVKRLEDLKVMKVDWVKVADVMEESARYVQEEFLK